MLAAALPIVAEAADNPFPKGLPRSPDFFPTAVWLQSPDNATKYKAIGINVYVALWHGPTEAQLDTLDRAGMLAIVEQSPRSLKFKDRPTIVGWMHGDEPDNAQSLGQGKGYGPPVPTSKIVAEYEAMRKADPERPVMLNLGQGVAWDGWFGRGVRTNHPEDYPEYARGSDIVSFDIYPACHENKDVAGKLWYVPKGVDRLREWTGGRKDVWCCIETTGIDNVRRKATPSEVRTEVWMALIHGAKGLIYFAHQFKPKFVEAGLLDDDAIAREVAAINRQIRQLAPVLNAPDTPGVRGRLLVEGRPDRHPRPSPRRLDLRLRRRHARGRDDWHVHPRRVEGGRPRRGPRRRPDDRGQGRLVDRSLPGLRGPPLRGHLRRGPLRLPHRALRSVTPVGRTSMAS